ncbi:MAG: putative ABC exporter domain-containing protein, partial [Anaerovoracaceae bacterium]
ILGSMGVYVLFSLMLLGINYLSMRFTEANISQGLLMVIYFFAVLLFLAPGLVAALIIGFSVGGLPGTLLVLFILSAWELAVALACFALSRNVLHNCDMPTIKR